MEAKTKAILEMLPRFLARDSVPTLSTHLVYREFWMPGSRARARVDSMRDAGLAPTSSQVTVPWAGLGRIEVTEIRVEPMPDLNRIPALGIEDVMPTTTTRQQRSVAARLRAGVESEG